MIAKLCEMGIEEWKNIEPCESLLKYSTEESKQVENAYKLQEFLLQLPQFMDAFPKGKKAQATWKQKGITWFENWIQENSFYLMQDMSKEDFDLFFSITGSFLKDVRAFDKNLSLEDTGQALRNVWIIAILQRIFNKPVGYHKAMFAYSMLYPYSDNYLDDPMISLDDKRTFNNWFTKRLQGEDVQPRNAHEEQISELVSMIEEVFVRAHYPLVFESLLHIQDAQIKSLHQQDGEASLSIDEMLQISYYKGGCSVVADAYLIDGSLRADELRFCMQYGFMLQLGDDLQDNKEDRLHNHQTLISTSNTSLDTVCLQLIEYTEQILKPSSVCREEALLEFVLRDCLFLIFLAIRDSEGFCSSKLIEEVKQCLPIHTTAMDDMRTSFQPQLSEEQIWERIECIFS